MQPDLVVFYRTSGVSRTVYARYLFVPPIQELWQKGVSLVRIYITIRKRRDYRKERVFTLFLFFKNNIKPVCKNIHLRLYASHSQDCIIVKLTLIGEDIIIYT